MLSHHILIGQVVRPQGVKGQVKIRPDTSAPERFEVLETVLIARENGAYEEVEIADATVRGEFVYAYLGEDQTREDAERRRDNMLYVAREDALALEENENFICDLVGCRVVLDSGDEIGKLVEVMQPGANDVYIIKTKKGELLVPALKKVVLKTDVENGVIVLDEAVLSEVAVGEY